MLINCTAGFKTVGETNSNTLAEPPIGLKELNIEPTVLEALSPKETCCLLDPPMSSGIDEAIVCPNTAITLYPYGIGIATYFSVPGKNKIRLWDLTHPLNLSYLFLPSSSSPAATLFNMSNANEPAVIV